MNDKGLLATRPSGHQRQTPPPDPTRIDSPHHHGSHRALLRFERSRRGNGADLDAIIVPTVHPPDSLRPAARLAAQLGCPLLLFCSGNARAAEVVAKLGGDGVPHLLAIDVPDVDEHPLLGFTTSSIHRAWTGRRVDTGPKRNLGLLVARIVGWRRIFFLDDDITVPDAADLRRAAGLLDSHDSVGLSIGGFPDNSVVCHANRVAAGAQDTFIGGGALAINVTKTSSFFPETYNEDWFFLLDFFLLEQSRRQPVAVTGYAVQRSYDPFAGPARAQYEEFGDVLAEGVFWLLDLGLGVKHATEGYWRRFLERRDCFIREIAQRIAADRALDRHRQESILIALKAAQAECGRISPSACAEYLQAWTADRVRWRNVVAALPSEPDPVKAVRRLGLRAVSAKRPPPAAPAEADLLGAGPAGGGRVFSSVRSGPVRSNANVAGRQLSGGEERGITTLGPCRRAPTS